MKFHEVSVKQDEQILEIDCETLHLKTTTIYYTW